MGLPITDRAEAVIEPIYTLPFYDSYNLSCGFGCYEGHAGVDYLLGVAGAGGERVAAGAAGTAKRCDLSPTAGNYMVIDHGNGHRTRYIHLRDPALPVDGQQVLRGQVVGYEGDTGDVRPLGTDQLHFETRHGATQAADCTLNTAAIGTAVDPYSGSSFMWTANPPQYPTAMMIISGCDASHEKDTLQLGGWIGQTPCFGTKAIAISDRRMMYINGSGAAFAKDSPNASWSQLTVANDAKAIAVGSSGLMMIINGCGAAYSKSTLGMGGWTNQTACGDAKAIAVGGSRMMLINGVNAAYAKDTIGPPWNALTVNGDAQAIAVGSSGRMMIINGCGASYSKDVIGMGGWIGQTACGDTKAIAVGGARMMIINGVNAAYAKDIHGPPWNNLTPAGTAFKIAVGYSGRMMIINNGNTAYGKDGLGFMGWTGLTANGDAKAIAVQG